MIGRLTVGVLVLAACVSCHSGREIVASLPPSPSDHGYQMVEGVTLPHGDVAWYCGPEVITAVLRHHGDKVTFEQAVLALYDPKRNGTLSLDMAKFARARGFDARLAKGTISEVEDEVLHGRPAILMLDVGLLPATWQLPFKTTAMYHYFVVVGVNVNERHLVAEGYGGTKQLLSYDALEAAWQPAGHYLLTIRPGAQGAAR